jgi:hypothetical protein
MLISLQGKLYAQGGNYITQHSAADRLFNIYAPVVNHLHTAHLLKNEKMILELIDITDYDMFQGLDSILTGLMQDIRFYKDSLPATGSVRIDYMLTEGSGQKMMRFKRYSPKGDLFVMQNNETAGLKLDQDTIHIILKKKLNNKGNYAHFYEWPVQVTFCLNNYTDIDTLLRDKGLITAIVDTLSKVIPPPKTNPERNSSFARPAQSTVDYYPYNKENKIQKTNYLVTAGEWPLLLPPKKTTIKVNAKIGAGLTMNTLTPMADIGLQYNRLWGWGSKDYSIFRLSATPYFFFNKDAGENMVMNDNWFVNAAIGSIYEAADPMWVGDEHTIGVGYLVSQKGGYFKNITFKVFTDLRIMNGITIVPEAIFTNNCKQIFPGITLKIF